LVRIPGGQTSITEGEDLTPANQVNGAQAAQWVYVRTADGSLAPSWDRQLSRVRRIVPDGTIGASGQSASQQTMFPTRIGRSLGWGVSATDTQTGGYGLRDFFMKLYEWTDD
jgi:hypothetical protein